MNAPFPVGDMSGDYQDYVQHALPTVEEQLTRLRAEYDSLAERYANVSRKHSDLQRDHTTLANKHEALFVRFDVIANDTDETEYLRKRVRRELVLHIEEWTQS